MSIDRHLPRVLLRRSFSRRLLPSCAAFLLAGCGGIVGVPLATGPPPSASPLTGNWQVAATTTSGAQPFVALTGSIVQESAPQTGPVTLVSVLQAIGPGQCYVGQTTVPSQGSLSATAFFLTSFSVDGQYLTISATPSATDDAFTGTFSISGGCGNGVQGNVTGTRVASLTGTYAGSLTGPPATLNLVLTQDAMADGLGYFHLGGSAAFSGISCFTGGTLNTSGSVISGEAVQLTIQTNESPSSTVVATGTVDPAADTLTLSSLQITSGGCAGTASSGTLTLQ